MARDESVDSDDDLEISDDDIVDLVDEDGETHTFVIMAIVDNGDQDFAVLSPYDQLQDDDVEEVEMFIFRYNELEDGEVVRGFSPVSDDEEYEAVRDFCMSLPQFKV